jgi:hypothetical protein
MRLLMVTALVAVLSVACGPSPDEEGQVDIDDMDIVQAEAYVRDLIERIATRVAPGGTVEAGDSGHVGCYESGPDAPKQVDLSYRIPGDQLADDLDLDADPQAILTLAREVFEDEGIDVDDSNADRSFAPSLLVRHGGLGFTVAAGGEAGERTQLGISGSTGCRPVPDQIPAGEGEPDVRDVTLPDGDGERG